MTAKRKESFYETLESRGFPLCNSILCLQNKSEQGGKIKREDVRKSEREDREEGEKKYWEEERQKENATEERNESFYESCIYKIFNLYPTMPIKEK